MKKNLPIGIAIVVALLVGYKLFFGNDIASKIADKLHQDAPMLDKSLLKSCAEDATANLTSEEKDIILSSLNRETKTYSGGEDVMAEMQERMQLGMTVLGEIMQCVNS